VTIYSKKLPPETTSNIAVASWSPGSAYETNAGARVSAGRIRNLMFIKQVK